jgi:hypothetical protein
VSSQLSEELEREKREIEQALNESIEATISEAWLPNTLAWVAVTLGAFLLNLVLLVLVAGG